MSNVEVTVGNTLERVSVAAKVEGAEPRPVPYQQRPTLYRPAGMKVEYANGRRNAGGDWIVSVLLWGPKIRKDGSDGAAEASEALGVRPERWPDWVAEFVEANKPRPRVTVAA